MHDYNIKLAKLAVNYSVKVKPGNVVVIRGHINVSDDLMKALYVEVLKAGGYPRIDATIPGVRELQLKYGSDDQLKYISPIVKTMYENMNCMIYIHDEYNPYKFQNEDPGRMQLRFSNPKIHELMKIRKEREASKDLTDVIIPNPTCTSLAQEAKMDYNSYFDFVSKALFLDQEDPIKAWQEIHDEQDRLIKILDNVKELHVLGEDTDIKMSLEGRKWINSDGTRNLPGGEVFTSPIEESINGHIRFTYPGIHMGKEVKNIYLDVKDGIVVKATADRGNKLLQQILKAPGGNMFGEMAIGTNKGITQHTKNMLFDEKMGHCIHMALGKGFAEANAPTERVTVPVHWDLLKDMTSPDSKIFADGKLIYEAGEWKI